LPILKGIIFATSMVNPSENLINLLGEKGSLAPRIAANLLGGDARVMVYQEQFLALYKDFVKVTPNTKLKEFIPLFQRFHFKEGHRGNFARIN